MKLEYSDVKKTAGKLKFRTKAFIGGKFVNSKPRWLNCPKAGALKRENHEP